MKKATKEEVEAKLLLKKAKQLVSASDRMQAIALAPETDPAFAKEARRHDAADRATRTRLMNQYRSEADMERREFRSKRAQQANQRRITDESDARAYKNTLRHASNALQRQLNTDPILRSAKAEEQRRRAAPGRTATATASAPSSKGHSQEGDEVLRRARNLLKNAPV